MIKKVLLALAAVLAAAYAALAAKVTLNAYLNRRVRAGRIASLTGGVFSIGGVTAFLKTVQFLGIDIDSYDDSYLAAAMLNGVLWKFTEEN